MQQYHGGDAHQAAEKGSEEPQTGGYHFITEGQEVNIEESHVHLGGLDGFEDVEEVTQAVEFPNVLDSILSLGGNVTLANLLSNPANIVDGIDGSLEIVQNLLGEGLGAELPMVGKYLYRISGYIGDVRKGAVADLRKAVNVNPIELVRDGLWDALGTPGLNVLTDRNNDTNIAVTVKTNCGKSALLFSSKLSECS